jgi:hypothetical protein
LQARVGPGSVRSSHWIQVALFGSSQMSQERRLSRTGWIRSPPGRLLCDASVLLFRVAGLLSANARSIELRENHDVDMSSGLTRRSTRRQLQPKRAVVAGAAAELGC